MQYVYRSTGTADANGDLTLTFLGRGGQPIKVTQVTVEMEDGASALCAVRLNGGLISPLVPTGDAAVGEPPIWVNPGDQLTAEWTGATVAGATGKMLVIYELAAAAI